MRFHFYSPKALEPWDWRNPDVQGIGNSETSHIEMACRLAARGHEVVSYTKLPADTSSGTVARGVTWRDLSDADFSQPGVWVLYRCPEILDQFTDRDHDQQRWLMFQDTHYDGATGRGVKVDKALVLCNAHRDFIADKFPELADKLIVTSNGVRVDMIEYVERRGLSGTERNPMRLHFSSSPDRGLKVLLEKIFPRAKEYVPELELHVYYGWNNIETLMAMGNEADRAAAKKFFGPNMEATQKLLTQPGVHWHGRIGQRELTREWLKAGLWVFPSMYPETGCATGMEAMALGAIPVAHPLWAVGEHTNWGTLIEGAPYGDPLTQARYSAEIVRLASQPILQERIRRQMMPDARARFDWDNFVPQWEAIAGVEMREVVNA